MRATTQGEGSAKYEFAEPSGCLEVTLRDDPTVVPTTPASVTRRLSAVSRIKAARPKSHGPDRLTNRVPNSVTEVRRTFLSCARSTTQGFSANSLN
jgi:hypothetical protein